MFNKYENPFAGKLIWLFEILAPNESSLFCTFCMSFIVNYGITYINMYEIKLEYIHKSREP